ncbi:hypothetical protein EV13_0111 [Prochlorococcus sp. MIT 0702]|nr:hypothetical protein EV12_1353 [Prochlorococcus sp. MIT 0701]KGG30674.1 hypothetical protein EV13_0111 [Prochlorococcus sp. MIT 0702]
MNSCLMSTGSRHVIPEAADLPLRVVHQSADTVLRCMAINLI